MKTNGPSLGLRALALPIFIENLLRIAIGSADVLMLSMYSDSAVAGVGLANQFAMFVMLVYTVVSVGTSIVTAQTLGAGNKEEASKTAVGSILLVGGFGLLFSLVMAVSAPFIFSLYPLEAEVRGYATIYLVIFGAGSVFMAMNLVQSGILRSYGHSKDPMVVTIIGNLFNVAGNYVAIMGLHLGFIEIQPIGVPGVALSTVFSQLVMFLLLAIQIKKHPEITIDFSKWREIKSTTYKTILRVGVPTAGETISYNTASMVLMSFAATMGTAVMSAWVYNITLIRFVIAASLSIGAATQIKVGYWVGAGKPEEAYKKVYQYYGISVLISMAIIVLIWLFRVPLVGIFTKDQAIASMVYVILSVGLILEPGRTANLVVIPALKGAGDVNFPVLMGIGSMWGIGVLGAWVLAFPLGLGFVGIWIGLCADEWFRGISMILRWRSKVWKSKALVMAPKNDLELLAPEHGGLYEQESEGGV